MGSLEEASSATANSVIPNTYQPSKHIDGIGDSSAVGEPLVEDVDQVHSDHDASIYEPLQTPSAPIASTNFQPLRSHPIASSSDEDPAPPPPDFTRRGIHIPTRTR